MLSLINKIRLRNKTTDTYLVLFVILITSFFIRVSTYSYPYEREDTNRDYLVARHIVRYGEYPLAGPSNAVSGTLKYSPAYYYLLTPLILINDDVFTLAFANIILQLITVLIIYKLASKLFGRKTALISASFFCFNPITFHHSAYIWQPWVMQPLVNLSYFMLLLSSFSKNYKLLLGSAFIFTFAATIHNSVFAVAPLFIILSILILRNCKKSKIHYLGLFAAYFSSLIIWYLPLFIHFYISKVDITSRLSEINFLTPAMFIKSFLGNISYFAANAIFYNTKSLILSILSVILIFSFMGYFLASLHNKLEKRYSFLIICSIFSVLICVSLINIREFTTNYAYYFTPVFGIFIVLLSRSISFLMNKNIFIKISVFLIILLYLGYFSLRYVYIYQNTPWFLNSPKTSRAVQAIEKEIIAIKKNEGFDDLRFFSIESSTEIGHGWQASIWVPLERDFRYKFVEVNDRDIGSFRELNKNKNYIFIICPNYSEKEKDKKCVDSFLVKYHNHTFFKNVYSKKTYRIDLIKKTL